MKQKILNEIIGFIVGLLLKFYKATCKKTILHPENFDQFAGKKFVFSMWHRDLFMGISHMCYTWVISMASKSKDGEIAAAIAKNACKLAARGSSSKGGRAALEDMIELSNSLGIPTGLTVDGPKGPIYKVKKGVIEVAVRTNAPIIPYVHKSSAYWEFNKSWDNFRMPKPFSHLYVAYGEPVYIDSSREDYIEYYSAIIEESMLDLEKEIDQLL